MVSMMCLGDESKQGAPVVAARLLLHQLVQVLPKLVLIHMVNASQVHLSAKNKDPLKFLIVGSQALGCLEQLLCIERRRLVQDKKQRLERLSGVLSHQLFHTVAEVLAMVLLLEEVQHIGEDSPGSTTENVVQLQLEGVLVPRLKCVYHFFDILIHLFVIHLVLSRVRDTDPHHRFELFLYVLLEVIVELVPVLRPVDLLDVVQRVRVPPSKDADYVVDPDRWQCIGISGNFQNFGS